MALRLEYNVTKLIERSRRHSDPVTRTPMAQSQPQAPRDATPEPATSGQKTLLQRAPTKFELYTVSQPDRLWPALPQRGALVDMYLPGETRRRHTRSHSPVPPAVIAKEERCNRCTRQEMWAAYDVFRSMDKRKLCKISRHDYLETMSNYPTLDKLKVLKRSGFEARFRENAKEVSLEEFLLMMWPQSNKSDMQKMMYWSKLRDAQELVRTGNYTGDIAALRQVFELLDKDSDHLLDDHELHGILEKREIVRMMNETANHRRQFKAEIQREKKVATERSKDYRSDLRRLIFQGRNTSSSVQRIMLQNEDPLKNKLTFEEFCHLVKPRQHV